MILDGTLPVIPERHSEHLEETIALNLGQRR